MIYSFTISVNDRVISPFREVFISRNFAYVKFRENKTLAKISEFTVSFLYNVFAESKKLDEPAQMHRAVNGSTILCVVMLYRMLYCICLCFLIFKPIPI